MAELLVLIDHSDGEPRKIALQMLTAVAGLADASGDSVAAVWLGAGADGAAAKLGAHGAAKLYHWDSEDATAFVTLPQVAALEAALEAAGADTLFFPSSNFVKDVVARLAIRTGAGVITDATGVEAGDGGRFVATKEVFGGDMITTVKVADGKPQFLGIASNAFPAEESGGGAPELVALDVTLDDAAKAAKVVDVEKQSSSSRPDVGEAAIVVAGGRGLGNENGFELMEKLADTLSAAVGASRAATDAGWYPHRYQIGQTGRTISPTLYIGSGISGAIQHRAGMQTSQHIVAINKDPEAPIFEIADFGIVGDLYEVVPKLIDEISSRKG